MRFLLLYLVICTGVFSSYAQSNQNISGYVRDARSGEGLIGAVVQVKDSKNSTSTNSYGFFSLNVPESKFILSVSYVGFQTLDLEVDPNIQRKFTFELVALDNMLEEVVISGKKRNENVTSPQMGVFNFSMEEVKNVPVLFGERDILKTIQMLPGVGKGGEGSSNFYVRGGGGDQNLILLDEATVYNASHLLGFFSTFNSDAIKDVELYKGGIPSQYGGRISSVMDIRMMDGNSKKFAAEGGIGLIASRIKLEGPIVKDKSSFMISGRRTYADMFLKLSKDESVNKSKLYFYDLNAKFNYRINDKNTIYVSGYFGKDDLGYSDLFSFDWGNATATVRWNHIFNEKLFSNTTLIYSDFTYNVNVSNDNNDFLIASKIKNFNLKEDFSFYASNKSTLRFGVNLLNQEISPASLNAAPGASVNTIAIEKRYGIELAGYLSHEWKPTEWLSAIYGVRLTDFMVRGPGTFYTYDAEGLPIDGKTYAGGVIKHYLNLEPRLSMSAILNQENSVKASYNRIVQNLHQLTNTTSSLPTDQYVMSSMNIKPQYADQVSLGYFRNLSNNKYEFSIESFYKKMGNQIDFRNGADLQANEYLEGELLNGKGRAYGLEFFLRKTQGAFTGWVSYTLAKSERQFEEINDGAWYNARQDRTHDISVVAMYSLTKNWTLGANFVYYTGNAVTYPSGKYTLGNETVYYYSERNGYRMPDYHRMDLSATYEPKEKKNKKFTSSWTFGVYNVYNRKNAYIIDFRDNESNPNITEAYKVALFGAIPSVTWNFKF